MTSDMLTIEYLFLTEKTENSYLRNFSRLSIAFVIADMFLKSYNLIRGRKCDLGSFIVQTNMLGSFEKSTNLLYLGGMIYQITI